MLWYVNSTTLFYLSNHYEKRLFKLHQTLLEVYFESILLNNKNKTHQAKEKRMKSKMGAIKNMGEFTDFDNR